VAHGSLILADAVDGFCDRKSGTRVEGNREEGRREHGQGSGCETAKGSKMTGHEVPF